MFSCLVPCSLTLLSEFPLSTIYHFFEVFNGYRRKGTTDGLRSFYALAAGAIEKGFGNIEGESSQLESLRNQAMKELKDWYHNGGKPREKVSFESLTVEASRIEAVICSRVEKAFAQVPAPKEV